VVVKIGEQQVGQWQSVASKQLEQSSGCSTASGQQHQHHQWLCRVVSSKWGSGNQWQAVASKQLEQSSGCSTASGQQHQHHQWF
jgi:hypothetical protein